MKKLVLTLAIIVSGVFAMQAQVAPEAVQKKALNLVNKITTTCSLTQDQAAKITPFVEAFMKNKMDNHSKFANNKPGMEEANKANRQQLKSGLKTILSDDQMKAFVANFKQNNGSNSYAPSTTK